MLVVSHMWISPKDYYEGHIIQYTRKGYSTKSALIQIKQKQMHSGLSFAKRKVLEISNKLKATHTQPPWFQEVKQETRREQDVAVV